MHVYITSIQSIKLATFKVIMMQPHLEYITDINNTNINTIPK